jgi:hypothetical protein
MAIGVCNYGCVKIVNEFQRPEHIELPNHSSEDQNIIRTYIERKVILLSKTFFI